MASIRGGHGHLMRNESVNGMPISYDEWQEYPWKNDLATQSHRVTVHFNEIISDSFEGEHDPLHMLDRAIVLTAFIIRRMIERKLVTDRLAAAKISVRSFLSNGDDEFRPPFHSCMGGPRSAAPR
jgi:hypothetical protein